MGIKNIIREIIKESLFYKMGNIPDMAGRITKSGLKKNDYIDADDIKEEKLISYEDRKKLSKSLSLFTIFLWILTSIIATKF